MLIVKTIFRETETNLKVEIWKDTTINSVANEKAEQDIMKDTNARVNNVFHIQKNMKRH